MGVNPGEVRGLDVRHGQPWYVSDGTLYDVSVFTQVFDELCMPLRAVTVGSEGGRIAHDTDMGNNAGHNLLKALAQPGIRNDGKGKTQAGQIESFARGHECDGPPGNVRIQRGRGDMGLVLIKDEAAMYLVGADSYIMFFADRSQGSQFILSEDTSHRVMGIA